MAVTGSPSRNRTPRAISTRRSEPFSRRQWRSYLHAFYEAASRTDAEAAFDRFLAKYQAKYDKAAGCRPRIEKRCSPFMTARPSTVSTRAFCSALVCWCTGDRVAKSDAAAGNFAGLPDQDAPPQLRPPCAGAGWRESRTQSRSCCASAARRAPFNQAGAASRATNAAGLLAWRLVVGLSCHWATKC